MKIISHWLFSTIAVMVVAYVLPGVTISSIFAAFVAAVIIGVLNAFIRPILLILTLPITLITFGLFSFVINACLIMVTAKIVDGFSVDGFVWALVFGLLLSLVSSVLNKFGDGKK